jgi:hypothetical protein
MAVAEMTLKPHAYRRSKGRWPRLSIQER